MKRIFCIAFISILCTFSFLTGYCSLYSVPVYGAQDQWETLTSNEQLVDAFKVYCKSRNIAIEGSVLDAVTSFTTTTFNNICNTLGIDITQLQAEIQRMYSGAGYKYAFSAAGLSGMNRIFAEFLQNNDLAVGDTVDDELIYSGEYFVDADGNGAFVYVLPVLSPSPNGAGWPNDYEPVSIGSTYIFDGNNIQSYVNGESIVLHLTASQDYTQTVLVNSDLTRYSISNSTQFLGDCIFALYNGSVASFGNACIMRVSNSTTLYYGYITFNSHDSFYYWKNFTSIQNAQSEESNIYITTNNNTINNETVINEGDTIIYNDDGSPDSGDDPEQDDEWNPVLPDVPGAGSDPSGGNTIDWPDLDLPDFDLPNFSLGDLRLKFPFSIPFDIVSILGVINAPAVAPVIQEDIPIRIDLMNVDYTIPINLDMSDSLYDNFAVLVRAVEFIGFCIGLIHLTIRLVKG